MVMLMNLLILAQVSEPEPVTEPSLFPWYSWVGLGLIIVILLAYKMYKNKTMT